MAVFKKAWDRFACLVSSRSPASSSIPSSSTIAKLPSNHTEESVKEMASVDAISFAAADFTLQRYNNEKKRRLSDDFSEGLRKRRMKEGKGIVNKAEEVDLDGSTLIQDTNHPQTTDTKSSSDRALMPPPTTPKRRIILSAKSRTPRHLKKDSVDDLREDRTEASFISTSTSRRRSNDFDNFDMEQARRHAAAIQLPPNSGVWAQDEQELFYHLALRGFEPLLPQNWMLDFKTLPLSLYAHENTSDPPLISNIHDTEFRAIRALRELVETGKNVRDKKLASPGLQAETTLEKAVRRYISWALADAGFNQDPDIPPVYAMVRMRKGQSSADTITDLKRSLEHLASRHRDTHGICASIESLQLNASSDNKTCVAEDEQTDLPVLVGLMIVSSLLVVFTKNPHSSTVSNDNQPADSIQQSTTDSAFRYISTFDFSNASSDVWNALSVAIVAMQIRKIMLKSTSNDEMALEPDSPFVQKSQLDPSDPDL